MVLSKNLQEFLDQYAEAWSHLAKRLDEQNPWMSGDVQGMVSAVNGGMVAVDKTFGWPKPMMPAVPPTAEVLPCVECSKEIPQGRALMVEVEGYGGSVTRTGPFCGACYAKIQEARAGAKGAGQAIPSERPASQDAPEPPKTSEPGPQKSLAPPARTGTLPMDLNMNPLPAFDKNLPGWLYCPNCQNLDINHISEKEKDGKVIKRKFQACYDCRVFLNIDKGQGRIVEMK